MSQSREPLLNAPTIVLAIPVLILGIYGLQTLGGPVEIERLEMLYALNPLLLRQGDWLPLITHIFLHGGLTHVLVNSAFCLAFAAPVARAQGMAAFFGFFVVCGVLAGLAYCAIYAYDNVRLVGASGAISGLLAASMRIRPGGGLYPIWEKRVLSMSVLYIGVNALTELLTLMPGAGEVRIAWQAHVAGYLAGLLLIGIWLRLFSPRSLRMAAD